jgi:hypothetical protein
MYIHSDHLVPLLGGGHAVYQDRARGYYLAIGQVSRIVTGHCGIGAPGSRFSHKRSPV